MVSEIFSSGHCGGCDNGCGGGYRNRGYYRHNDYYRSSYHYRDYDYDRYRYRGRDRDDFLGLRISL